MLDMNSSRSTNWQVTCIEYIIIASYCNRALGLESDVASQCIASVTGQPLSTQKVSIKRLNLYS